jgi:predicted kinase
MATLILFSGLPGCGKTTLARRLASHQRLSLVSKDRVQRVLRDSECVGAALLGYQLILDLADEQLALGVSVIVEAVFPRVGFRADANEIAARNGAWFRPVVCVCSDEYIWRARIGSRTQYVPGWTPVGWEEVERLRGEFETWDESALVLDTVQPVEANFERLLRYLDSFDSH